MRQRLLNAREGLRRTPWPAGLPAGDGVAAVVVNYNTKQLIAALLLSVYRVLPPGSVETIVVVDNGSTDGSAPFLRALRDRGLIRLVENTGSTYHGPGLNAGINELARLRKAGEIGAGLVWVLDSDVLVLRGDVLADAVPVFAATGAAMVGQARHGDTGERPYTLISCQLLDPAKVWQRGIRPFWDHGDPGVAMQESLDRKGLVRADFSFYRSGYVLHRGRATIKSVFEQGITENRWFAAGAQRGEPHFHGHPDGEAIYDAFLARMEREAPGLDPDAFVAAARDAERIAPV